MSGRISSFAQPLQQEYLLNAQQSQLTSLTNEIASGEKANPAAAMGNDVASLYQLQTEENQQTTLQTVATAAGDKLTAMQTALSSVASAAQTIATAGLSSSSAGGTAYATLGTQASSTMAQVADLLNTQYEGSAVFAGDAGTPPMQSMTAANGPNAAISSVLNAAVAANGGQPLTAANVSSLLTGPNGLSSIFSNTNGNAALNYNQAFYTGSTDGQPTTVPIGVNQTVQYNAAANQPAFTDLMQGLSMMSLLSAPSSQLDDTAKAAILTQANGLIGQAQNELTQTQGALGGVQAQLQQVADAQQSAANNTTQQLSTLEGADMTADSTKLSALQTQLEASYQVTSLVSQLTLSHYLPTLTS